MSEQGPAIAIEPKIEAGPASGAPGSRSPFELWTPIIVALITVLGTILVAYIGIRGQLNQHEARLNTLNIVDLQLGKTELGQYVDRDFNLATPRPDGGARVFTKRVRFTRDFTSPPTVFLSLSELDLGNEAHIRVLAYPGNITNEGFDVNVQTWAQSRVHTVSVEWIAVQTERQRAR